MLKRVCRTPVTEPATAPAAAPASGAQTGGAPATSSVAATATVVNLLRLHREEAHLAEDAEYRAYQDRVRWRLVPFVW